MIDIHGIVNIIINIEIAWNLSSTIYCLFSISIIYYLGCHGASQFTGIDTERALDRIFEKFGKVTHAVPQIHDLIEMTKGDRQYIQCLYICIHV